MLRIYVGRYGPIGADRSFYFDNKDEAYEVFKYKKSIVVSYALYHNEDSGVREVMKRIIAERDAWNKRNK